MNLKKITSLTMLLAMLLMTYTGIILFIAPPGRIANWANWEIFALTKEQYASIHTVFMVLFVVASILHIYYNWKPITSYMKNEARQLIVFTKEMVVSVILTFVFLLGTLYEISPFSSFINFGEEIKESWEKTYGSAPYSHAELSSLESFCKKMGYDLATSQQILQQNKIEFLPTQSLSLIAKDNNVSPQFIYDLLKNHFAKGGKQPIQLTGLGKLQVKDVASRLNLSSQEFLEKLKSLGIVAQETDKFKDVTESYDMSPTDVMTKLGYEKPE